MKIILFAIIFLYINTIARKRRRVESSVHFPIAIYTSTSKSFEGIPGSAAIKFHNSHINVIFDNNVNNDKPSNIDVRSILLVNEGVGFEYEDRQYTGFKFFIFSKAAESHIKGNIEAYYLLELQNDTTVEKLATFKQSLIKAGVNKHLFITLSKS
jgi:hypothetical protein